MGSLFRDTVMGFFGIACAGVPALLLLYVAYRMARQEILLFGSVVPGPNGNNQYSFFIQNLEEFSFPGPIIVRVTDKRTTASEVDTSFSVELFAGPKSVRAIADVVNPGGTANREWRAVFEELPAYDAWRFNCETKSSCLEISIDPGDEVTTLRPRLIKDVSHRRLLLTTDDGQRSRYAGATVTPPFSFLGFVWVALIGAYLGGVYLMNRWGAASASDASTIGRFDLAAVLAIVVLLYLGYRLIQRPVYPIIQGYFFQTNTYLPPRPSDFERVSSDKTPSAPKQSAREPLREESQDVPE
jgi:hypothetical protein